MKSAGKTIISTQSQFIVLFIRKLWEIYA